MSYDCGIGVIFGNVFLDCFFGVIGFVGVLAVLCGCVDCAVSGCVSGVGLLVVWDSSVFRSVVFGCGGGSGVGCELYRIRKYLLNSYMCLRRCCINFMY